MKSITATCWLFSRLLLVKLSSSNSWETRLILLRSSVSYVNKSVKSIGELENMDKCKRCGEDNKVVDLPIDRKIKKGQKYYYTRYYKCLVCGFHSNSNDHKVIVEEEKPKQTVHRAVYSHRKL